MKERNTLVFDLGGGTLDVSVLLIDNQNYTVLGTHGDTHLGGEDLDNRIVKYCVEEFKNKLKIDLTDNKKAISRIRQSSEQAKILLSS